MKTFDPGWIRLLLPLAAACWLSQSGSARAECLSSTMATLSHCNNCRVAASLAVARDQTCERPLNPRAGEDVQILGLRIARGAKHGRAGTSSFMIAYSPAKGYIGADQFVVEFAWRRGPETGKVFIDFDVTVK